MDVYTQINPKFGFSIDIVAREGSSPMKELSPRQCCVPVPSKKIWVPLMDDIVTPWTISSVRFV